MQPVILNLYVSTHKPNLAGVVRHLIQPNPLLGFKELAQNKYVLLSEEVGRDMCQLVDQRRRLIPQLIVPHNPPENTRLHSDLNDQT